ncbi:MAG TPA: protein kinase, partial [Thermoanaerobaculia bacterium]
IKRVLAITAQVADGLARAHEAGIVHRDLKPENVMVAKDGRVKVLDFGLAKLTHMGIDSAEGTNIPTETGTGAGVVLGTVGYMSPEQAGGQPVDFRSDQFSFGSILYELATGKRAFQKKTAVDTLSAILNEEPESISAANPQAPTPLRWIVERCLAKDREERYGSTRDLARDLVTLRDHLTEPVGLRAIESSRRPRRALGALAAVAILSAGVFMGRRLLKEPLPLAPTFEPLTFRRGSISSAKFTADGNTIVYSASWGGEPQQLFATRPENPESQTLPFPGAEVAAISSRGEMALLKDGILSRAALAGGAARDVLENVSGADWSPDGSQLAVIHNVSGRPRIEYPIGKVLYEGQQGGAIWYVRVSPKGDRIAFDDCPQPYGDGLQYIAVVDLQGRKTTLTPGWFGIDGVVWSPVGDEIWFVGGQGARRHGELHAISPVGKERIVLRAPGTFMFSDLTRDGRGLLILAFCRTSIAGVIPGESAERDLSWFDGSAVEDLSPDGRTLLFTEGGVGGQGDNAVYIRKLDGSPPVRIGENAGSGGWCLSPDGRWTIARVLTATQKLTLIPTGTGGTRTLERGSIEQYW